MFRTSRTYGVCLFAAAAVAAVVAVPVVGSPIASATGARNGLIAYSTGNGEEVPHSIWMIRPDGTGNRRLLHAHRRSPQSGPSRPNWSPDGTKLLFFRGSDRENTSAGSLWYLTVATGQLRRIPLAAGRRSIAGFDWAPDGRRLVVSLAKDCCNGMLYTLRVDGSHLKKLRRGRFPSWAGRHIAFQLITNRSNALTGSTINVVRPNGTGFRRLSARSANDSNFSFSPRGTKLVYVRYATPTTELRMVDVTGRNDVLLQT